ncbi:cyclin-domain-containing protein [Thelonectria olida]|uniref:Cyclin-domain-containing protein n=1 Tax=Thelonectria olida TaxID=1576542 RepID=A0A9P8WEZ6_9HYPO|nr:cyclin-domain-containing protein [Thelonectria olida]
MANQPSADGTTENHHSKPPSDLQHHNSNESAHPPLPSPPVPSSDPHLASESGNSSAEMPANIEHAISKMAPSEALTLLSANLELLVRLTGDVPPTPPPKSPTVPHMSGMQAEKENIARTHSDKNLAKLRKQAELEASKEKKAALEPRIRTQDASTPKHGEPHKNTEGIDGVQLKQPSAPTSPAAKPTPYIIIGADSQPINLQHGVITRKFYSKNEPPISISQYLMRLHQFCPMSTAVYLATSLYIHRLAVDERAIPVTRLNAHRLVLAGLRVAMKALEDQSYPHSKMSKVGGVSEAELARLEISFCFLANFDLVVDLKRLQKHCDNLKDGAAGRALGDIGTPTLVLKRPRERAQHAV